MELLEIKCQIFGIFLWNFLEPLESFCGTFGNQMELLNNNLYFFVLFLLVEFLESLCGISWIFIGIEI